MSMKDSTTQSGGTTSTTTNPWSVQAPYLTQAFSGASDALTKAQGATAPTDFTAQFTPDQLSMFQKMMDYGTGNTGIAGSSAAAGGALTGAGSSAVQGGLSGLDAFKPAGGTQSNIDAANAYAGNQPISAMTDAAMRDVNRVATEQTLPGIARGAAASGNINSNRPDIASGIVQRGLNDQAGDISANLRGQAYNTGLGLAEQNSEASNASQLQRLMGLTSGGNSAVDTGVNANSGAVGQQTGLYGIAGGGAAGQQAGAQANLTNQSQQFQSGTSAPFAALQNFYNIIGANNWGGSSTGTTTGNTTSTPSVWQTIGGLMNAGGSLMKSDRRVKNSIHEIGALFDGTPVYRFSYIDDPTQHTHIGLMAQDVEETFPAAVIEVDGIKHINIDLATRASAIN